MSKRCELYLDHAFFSFFAAQKRELLVTLSSRTALFAQDLIEKMSRQVKEDSFISSSLSLAKLACFQLLGGVSPLRPLELRAPLVRLVHRVIRPRWTTRFSALSLPLGNVPPLPAEVAVVSGLGVAGLWLFLQNLNGFQKWEPYPCLSLTGRCLPLHWQAWRDRGADPWVVEVLWVGYHIPLLSVPPLSSEPIPMVSYSPSSIMGKALEEVVLSLVERDTFEPAPLPSLGFYSVCSLSGRLSGHGDQLSTSLS